VFGFVDVLGCLFASGSVNVGIVYLWKVAYVINVYRKCLLSGSGAGAFVNGRFIDWYIVFVSFSFVEKLVCCRCGHSSPTGG
jgi:hypothetical protein